jgi:hypothetical protein
LHSAMEFTRAEQEAVNKVENYFKSKNMTLQEKLFHALLIAQHDLDAMNFTSPVEEVKISEFKQTINNLLCKMRQIKCD